jgi:NCS1 family nucleobase:cation symporter-1
MSASWVATVTVLASVGVAAALVLVEAQGWLENELLLVGYWIPAWAAVLLLDWRRHPALEAAARTASFRALPAGRNAVFALLLGAAAAVPFVDQELFVGPVASALGGADLGYVVSFVVAGMTFALLEHVRPTPRRVALFDRPPTGC